MAPAVTEEFRQESSEEYFGGESDGDTADPKQFDQITCFERWRNHGKRNQETQNKNARLDRASEQ